MARQLRIAVDCDDVLLPTAASIVDNYSQHYGVDVDLANFYSDQPGHWGVEDIRTANERVARYLGSHAFAAIKPDPAAIEAVHRISNQHRLFLVTARSDELANATQEMIDQYFSGCFTGIELTNHFGDSRRRRTKGSVCRALGAAVLIDDNPHHINNALDEASLSMGILFGDYPWNMDGCVQGPAVRCNTCSKVEATIDELANQ